MRPLSSLRKLWNVCRAATGEKRFAGAGGVLTIQGGAEHWLQAVVFVLDQVIDHPAAQAILFRYLDFLQVRDGHLAVFVMQLGNDLQVEWSARAFSPWSPVPACCLH